VFIGALSSFKELNDGYLPERIVIYRNDDGDGQIAYVYKNEVAIIKV
jgi:hypothetical protein